MTLEQLERTFDRHRAEFVEHHHGEWVLLFSNGESQFFEHERDAIRAGYDDRRGLQFLVKQALTEDRVIMISQVYLAGHR